MAVDRYLLLGLARPRTEWFAAVARWATSAALPADYLKCLSLEEVRVRLGDGRRYSAVLVDGTLLGVDRDLIGLAREVGCAVIVIDDGRRARDWWALGASAVLAPPLERDTLLDTLRASAVPVTRVDGGSENDDAAATGGPPGAVAAVCGAGGTGVSTVAAALAQGLADGRRVVLADLAAHAQQAVLHDVRDIVPGIPELAELHRNRQPTDEEVRELTFEIVDRGYRLLLGLRRARQWTTLRTRSWNAAFLSLRRCFDVTVCDVAADLEGEAETGSTDIQDRNLIARTTMEAADVVFVVGRPGTKGTHSLVRVLGDLAEAGVPGDRLVPVVNLAPRHPRVRAEVGAAIAALVEPQVGREGTAPTVFLPNRRTEAAWRDAGPMPAPLPELLAGTFDAVLARRGGRAQVAACEPLLVVPGSLGHWSEGVG